ncbi:MAG: DUF2147 domain-containing protein [Salibacteraceae bacterium]
MKQLLLVTFLLMAGNAIGYAQNADDILGIWFNEEKTAKIEIYKNGDKYFGKIVWLKEPLRDGKPKLDIHNDDESLRSRPVMGLNILQDFVWDEDDKEWNDGTIYDPKNGETYSCYITKKGDVLHVRGYIGFSFIGRTTEWTRAE